MRWLSTYTVYLRLIPLLAVLLVTVSTSAYADEVADREYKVKAVFLYNFFNFVQWPAAALAESNSAPKHTICIIGTNMFGKSLDYIHDKKPDAFDLLYSPDQESVNRCTVVFFSKSLDGKIDAYLRFFKNRPVLTVSDIDNFTEIGGMIGMPTNDNKVQLRINKSTFTQAGFTSSQLLEMAEIVE